MKKEELARKLEPRQPIYKATRLVVPFCPVCKGQLLGNNSIILPWTCACGDWEPYWPIGEFFSGTYKIKIKAL